MGNRTCALVGASEFNAQDFLRRWMAGQFDCVVAVDAGLACLEDAGCTPDLLLGDFDSLGYVPEGKQVEVHPSHKDESDMELAFAAVCERGFEEVVVYGALGRRLDHTIANLQMCARFAEAGLAVTLVGLDSAVRILVGPDTLVLPQLERGTVSVFSACDESVGVTERGMEYSLDNATLTNRTSLGLSNELTGAPAWVRVQRGTLYVFYPIT